MTIRHFVITRFLSNSKMHLGDRVFDKDMIENGIHLLKTYLLPSLEHQICKNFEWIIMVHKNASKEYLKPLYELNTSFKTTIIEVEDDMKNMESYIFPFFNECDRFITTRIDYDDQIYAGAVESVQRAASKSERAIYVYTWQNVTYHDIITNLYFDRANGFAKNHGGYSVFLTIVQNTKGCSKPINVYCGNHTRLADDIVAKGYSEGLTVEEVFVQNTNAKPAILYTVHNCNDSGSESHRLHRGYTKFDYDVFYKN